MRSRLLATLSRGDPTVTLVALLLAGLGIFLIRSATADSEIALELVQLKWLALSILIAVPVALYPYTRALRHASLFYGGGLVLLVLVKLIGPVINGSQRWIVFGGSQLQPSEPMKVFTIMLLAWMLRFGRALERPKAWMRPLIVALLPMALIFVQPDLGTSLLFVPVAVAVVLVSGIPLRALVLLTVLGASLLGGSFLFLLEPYQKERVLSTLNHSRLTATQRAIEGFQLEESLLAIGNGGFAGHGHGLGPRVQSGRLPHQHNDFIFAVLAEEHGFAGAMLVLCLILLLVFAIFRVAERTRDPAGRLLCVGVGTLFGFQSLVHVAVTLGVAPTTGMTLPLISYGGSSLLTQFIALALVLNVSIHRPRVPIRSRQSRSILLGVGTGA